MNIYFEKRIIGNLLLNDCMTECLHDRQPVNKTENLNDRHILYPP